MSEIVSCCGAGGGCGGCHRTIEKIIADERRHLHVVSVQPRPEHIAPEPETVPNDQPDLALTG